MAAKIVLAAKFTVFELHFMSKYRRGIAALNESKNDPGCAERALRRQAARTNSTTERHDLGSTALNICLHFHSFGSSTATEYRTEWAELQLTAAVRSRAKKVA